MEIYQMNVSEIIGKTFYDSYMQSHTVKSVLGQGGQGIVCKTETEDTVLKFVTDETGNLISKKDAPEIFERYTTRFKSIYLQPFPDGLHLAYPMAVLDEYSGYVMRLMDDMTSFGDFLSISNFPKTGGHRRRFELLSKAATILAQLHSAGMVYCDISPNNIFMTNDADAENQNVWFIDADNIFLATSQARKVYTPRYAAPELYQNDAKCTQNSDVYSFATLAYECLAAVHPFAGKKTSGNWVDDSSSDDWDKTASNKERALPETEPMYSGKFPWVLDSADDSNKTADGLPPETFLNGELYKLFDAVFSRGRLVSEKRPPIFLWPAAFARASDSTVKCTDCDCGMSHIYDEKKRICPFCKKELPPVLLIKKDSNIVFSHEIIFTEKSNNAEKIVVPERIFMPFDMIKNSLPILSINVKRDSNSGNAFYVTLKKREIFDFSKINFFVKNSVKETALISSVVLTLNKGEQMELSCEQKNYGDFRKESFTVEIQF